MRDFTYPGGVRPTAQGGREFEKGCERGQMGVPKLRMGRVGLEGG